MIVEVEADAGLAHVLLDELGEVGHLEAVPGGQLHAEAVLLARGGEQLLRLGHVPLALLDLGGRPEDGRERAVVAVVGLRVEQAVDERAGG